MQEFTYHRADTIPAALSANGRFLAGGTTLIDLMKLDVETPKAVVDIHRLPLDKIETLPGGGLRIGATVRNSDLAHHRCCGGAGQLSGRGARRVVPPGPRSERQAFQPAR